MSVRNRREADHPPSPAPGFVRIPRARRESAQIRRRQTRTPATPIQGLLPQLVEQLKHTVGEANLQEDRHRDEAQGTGNEYAHVRKQLWIETRTGLAGS